MAQAHAAGADPDPVTIIVTINVNVLLLGHPARAEVERLTSGVSEVDGPITRVVNGKVDEKALPEAVIGGGGAGACEKVKARKDTERVVIGVFEAVSGAVGAGMDDELFGIGGSSLGAMRAVSLIREQTGVSVPVRVVYELGTVRKDGEWVEAERGGQGAEWTAEARSPPRPGFPLPLARFSALRAAPILAAAVAAAPSASLAGTAGVGVALAADLRAGRKASLLPLAPRCEARVRAMAPAALLEALLAGGFLRTKTLAWTLPVSCCSGRWE